MHLHSWQEDRISGAEQEAPQNAWRKGFRDLVWACCPALLLRHPSTSEPACPLTNSWPFFFPSNSVDPSILFKLFSRLVADNLRQLQLGQAEVTSTPSAAMRPSDAAAPSPGTASSKQWQNPRSLCKRFPATEEVTARHFVSFLGLRLLSV